tara:strand:+ start:281 stop:1258 length:978 start_codon:yes stop_codon:yes gene_type:complete
VYCFKKKDLKLKILNDSINSINTASKLIKSGDAVAVITETVYGLAVDASNKTAIKKLYSLKKRPKNNPLIIHVESINMALKFGKENEDFLILASTFWPGPLTIILPKKKDSSISKEATAGLNSIALRMPKSKVFLKLIKKVGKPLAAPSANLSGYISATDSKHVKECFNNNIKLILDSGRCEYGLESTVINLTKKPYIIERMGVINKEEIFKKTKIFTIEKNLKKKQIVSPGQLSKHYAPKKPLRLNAKFPNIDESFLAFGKNFVDSKYCLNLSKKSNLKEAAYNLFYYLRKLDNLEKKKIAVSPIPMRGLGKTINERLKRASYR